MADRSARVAPFGGLNPDNRSLHRELLFHRVKGDLQRGPGTQDPGEMKHESAATNIGRPSLEGRPLPVLSPAGHGESQGQPNSGVANRTLGSEQASEGLMLIGRDFGKRHAVRNAPRRRDGLSRPDHPRVQLDGALIRLETDEDWGLGSKTVGQLETRAPFAEVPGPTHPSVDPRARLGPMQERKVNGIPQVASGVGPWDRAADWLL